MARGVPILWTEKELETTTEMWKAGCSARDIANRIGKSRNAVLGMLFRRGITRPSWSRMSDVMLRHRIKGRKIAKEKAAKVRDNPTPPKGVTPLLRPLLELGACQCRYPYGGHADPGEMRFCAILCSGPGVYCSYHAKICYTSPAKPKSR